MAFSNDCFPIIGPIGLLLEPKSTASSSRQQLDASMTPTISTGDCLIATGFTGHGMTVAFGAGYALADMVRQQLRNRRRIRTSTDRERSLPVPLVLDELSKYGFHERFLPTRFTELLTELD
jgi:glycine/D-amino acid oxidase-like deaminating enzyme